MLARVLILAALLLPLPAMAQLRWVEGRHFTTIAGGKPAESQPGKIEVAEVFSYGCVHCYRTKDIMAKLQDALPADAYMTYVHASFRPEEAWPMYQRAWYTARAMGIGAATHDRMFAAVWESGEVALFDRTTNRLLKPLPTIEQAARFYARAARVREADFLKLAKSPAISAQMKQADAQIQSWRVPGTPALIVNGRYLVNNDALVKWNDARMLVLFLVDEERRRMKLPRPAAAPAAPASASPQKLPAGKP